MATALIKQPFVAYAKKRHRIGNVSAAFLIGVAFIVDSIQFLFYLVGLIPFIGQLVALIFPFILSVMAWIMFYLWFKLLGVDFLDGLMRKAITLWGTAFIEMVPILSAVPAWTFGIMLLITIVRLEDHLYNKRYGIV